jgi:ABC-type phosphate/phosphonate transport system ATPase subunit
MKKHEIALRLESMLALDPDTSVDVMTAIQELMDDLKTASVEDKGKLVYFVTVNEKKLDPAVKYPKQMIICHDILSELEKPELTLKEVQEVFKDAAERLGTRQDPYRIYAFYQKRMADEGWIERETQRI